MAETTPSIIDLIDTTTILSLLSTLAILATAYALSLTALSPSSPTKIRILFIWHAFDALIHFILEGSYLYNCFFSHLSLSLSLSPSTPNSASKASEFLPPGVYFLGRRDRLYGASYGNGGFSALWREYAKADRRWGGSDLTVVSLELLTVGLMAPVAVWVCCCLSRNSRIETRGLGGSEWFWMVVLATGELYGGEYCVFLLSGCGCLKEDGLETGCGWAVGDEMDWT